MDYQHKQVFEFHLKAGQQAPGKPTVPPLETRKFRAKLILEEVFEIIEEGLGLAIWDDKLDEQIFFKNLAFYDDKFPNLQKLADGCGDSKVVIIGTEIAFGIDGEPIFNEIMRSNMTKFIDGHAREDGKWMKGPSYEPPNLLPILKEQGADL